ncbi:Uncharacterised protein [Mycobacteroides abscessus]|nr:Uncharacterised protein [Mycobacteroides abscessus]
MLLAEIQGITHQPGIMLHRFQQILNIQMIDHILRLLLNPVTQHIMNQLLNIQILIFGQFCTFNLATFKGKFT